MTKQKLKLKNQTTNFVFVQSINNFTQHEQTCVDCSRFFQSGPKIYHITSFYITRD